jgi:prepilin-type processing-associated H-X9-DG protein
MVYGNEFGGAIVPAECRDPLSPVAAPVMTDTWYTIFVSLSLVPTQGNQRLVNPPTPPKTPMGTGVFFCPSGLTDAISNELPLGIVDAEGERPTRGSSASTKIHVDSWYGMNGGTSNSGTHTNHWLPGRRIPGDSNLNDYALARVSDAGSGDIVLFFDGVFMNQGSVDPFRVNGRHRNKTVTNLVFVDGHAEAVLRRLIPGGTTVGTVATPSTIAPEFWNPLASGYPRTRWMLPQPAP